MLPSTSRGMASPFHPQSGSGHRTSFGGWAVGPIPGQFRSPAIHTDHSTKWHPCDVAGPSCSLRS
jgi:hypothetical protein